MTSDTEPRTAAGRQFASSFVTDGGHLYGGTAKSLAEAVRAIEDESWNAALREVAIVAGGQYAGVTASPTVERAVILRAIASLRKPVTP